MFKTGEFMGRSIVFDEWAAPATPDETAMHKAIQQTGIGTGFLHKTMRLTITRVENLSKLPGAGYDEWRTLWAAFMTQKLLR